MKSEQSVQPRSAWLRLKRHFTEAFSGELITPQAHAGARQQNEWLGQSRSRNAHRYILAVIAAAAVPVTAFNIYYAEWVLVAGASLVFFAIIINFVLLSIGRASAASPLPVLLCSIFLSILAFYRGQEHALLLLYPLLVLLPVLLSLRGSITLGLVALVAIGPRMLELYSLVAVAIVALSFCLTWMISAWLMFSVREQARRLKEMVITDPLTGVFNRRYLELQAERALLNWQRSNSPMTLLLIDLDHFKAINDEFGHAAGDSALRQVAQLVTDRVRKTDVFCRYGGEEFVLLLEETSSRKAVKVAQELCSAVAAADVLPAGTLTISIGVCDIALADSVEHWFKLADNALYIAKDQGRNRVEVAEQGQRKVVPISKTVPDWR